MIVFLIGNVYLMIATCLVFSSNQVSRDLEFRASFSQTRSSLQICQILSFPLTPNRNVWHGAYLP